MRLNSCVKFHFSLIQFDSIRSDSIWFDSIESKSSVWWIGFAKMVAKQLRLRLNTTVSVLLLLWCCDLKLTHACACFGGWSGAMDAGCRDKSGIPPVRRIPDGVLDSCISGIFDDALSLDSINSRSIWQQEIEKTSIIILHYTFSIYLSVVYIHDDYLLSSNFGHWKMVAIFHLMRWAFNCCETICHLGKCILPEIWMNAFAMIPMKLLAVYHW